MSGSQRYAVGIVLALSGLAGATALWYQKNYVAPFTPTLTPAPARAIPAQNGFDTLKEALRLRKGPVHTVSAQAWRGWEKQPLAERQKLLAENQPFLAKTREALTQEYWIPYTSPAMSPEFLHSHLGELLFATKTYHDSKNIPESMRCLLDVLEFAMVVPRGGGLNARNVGVHYEAYSQLVAWALVDRVDARTAREAVARLTQRETRRWPLSENLREDLRQGGVAQKLFEFQAGPISTWETKLPVATASGDLGMLWNRAQVVYGGPKALIEAADRCVQQARERLKAPWQPNRPKLSIHVPSHPWTESTYADMEQADYLFRTQAKLLRTHLALRAYFLERGSYPKSLETLVKAGYLKALPGDPYAPTQRTPLQYRLSGKTFLLWSVGPDGKDDGGQGPLANRKQPTGRSVSGDIVGKDYSYYKVIYKKASPS